MTPQQILDLKQKIRELDAEAANGPWKVDHVGNIQTQRGAVMPQTFRDADFIAFARTALPTLLAYCEELEGKVNWQPIETPPTEYETVLTIHEKDLAPVCAFRIYHAGRDIWLRTIEGPEDLEHPASNEELYRPPTHWMPPPPNPQPI